MNELVVAADFGSSLGRAIYTTNSGYVKPELVTFDPEVVEVPGESIANYEKYRLGETSPENSSWVKVGETYYAVGFLAKDRFSTTHCRNSLKIDSAIPLTLSILGAIAHKRDLPEKFSVSLGIVLPFSEFRDREKFATMLTKHFSSFTYRGTEYQVDLTKFTALPEGGGLLARSRVPKKGQLLVPAAEINLVVLMLGYRNTSLLVMEKGQLTKGLTCDLGFSQLVERVQQFTSGQTESALVRAICSAREVSDTALEAIALSNNPELRAMEVIELKGAIADARKEYLALLTNWLSQQIPASISLDEILIGGGTAQYLKPELTAALKRYRAQLNWGKTLEMRVKQAFETQVRHHSLAMRLADVYGLFYKMLGKPLPRLKEKPVNARIKAQTETTANQPQRSVSVASH